MDSYVPEFKKQSNASQHGGTRSRKEERQTSAEGRERKPKRLRLEEIERRAVSQPATTTQCFYMCGWIHETYDACEARRFCSSPAAIGFASLETNLNQKDTCSYCALATHRRQQRNVGNSTSTGKISCGNRVFSRVVCNVFVSRNSREVCFTMWYLDAIAGVTVTVTFTVTVPICVFRSVSWLTSQSVCLSVCLSICPKVLKCSECTSADFGSETIHFSKMVAGVS